MAVPDFRIGPFITPRWTSRRDVAARPRYRSRVRKLSPDQEVSIRTLGTTKSLRALAAEFGVSHETIRAVRGQAPAA